MKHFKLYLLIVALIASVLSGCKKQDDWLSAKNNKSSVVPETLNDYQALLDNIQYFNRIVSTAGAASSDDLELTTTGYTSSGETDRNLYLWKREIWATGSATEWNYHYRAIATTNLVLEGLVKQNSDDPLVRQVKGQAHFLRALSYYTLAQLFCKPYSSTAGTDLGLPLRLASDVNIIQQRASLSDTYQQILKDAQTAAELLPGNRPYLTRPVSAAATALMARIFLQMDDYANAEKAAAESLKLRPELINFNNNALVSVSKTYRFPVYGKENPEILFYAEGGSYATTYPATNSTGLVATELYDQYEENDLRKTLFFLKTPTGIKYRGSYSGRLSNFGGLASNEMYLIVAECAARNGQTEKALKLLNDLLVQRYLSGKFIQRTAGNSEEVLQMILQERRKELAFVGNARWEDLRRLNKEARFKKTVTRNLNGQFYSLAPGDKLYTLPIPQNEIQQSHIQQNER
jgi:hypothetical protein